MTIYAGITLLTELFMLAMTIHVIQYPGFTRVQKVWFLLTFLTVMFCSAAEFAVHCGTYDPRFALPLTILTVLQFSASPLLGILFTGALGVPRQQKITVVFLALNLLVEIAAAPFGWVFYFNQEGYFRGEHFFLYEVFYFFSLIYLLFSMFKVGRRFRHRDVITIVMILVVLVAGIVPMTIFKINITYMAIAISASLSYIFYNDPIQQDIQAELVANQEKISETQEHIISGLANLIESRDLETGEHVARTSQYVKALTEYAREEHVYADQLDDRLISMMCRVAPLHDVGKIVVPDHILKKPGRLTDAEFEQMKRHASEGGRVVRELLSGVTDDEYLSFAADVATSHHERWDGKGYPSGLSGEKIPLPARIMAIADVFDALVSKRCYKQGMPPDQAFAIIREGMGTQFDPNLARVFLEHQQSFAELCS